MTSLNSESNYIILTKQIDEIVSQAISSAIKYEKLTGRKLGITGEIGEYKVCKKLGLNLLKDRQSAGYDAVDKDGKKYQIKTRRVSGKKGRIGKFSEHFFDFAVLALLDENYEITDLFTVEFDKINEIISIAKNRNPSFSKFKSVCK